MTSRLRRERAINHDGHTAHARARVLLMLIVVCGCLTVSADALALPEGRAWEQVSPIDKHGIALEPMSQFGGDIQASASGEAFTYIAAGPVAEPAGNRALEFSQLFSKRGPSGWTTQDIATPHNEVTGLSVGENSEYKIFSPDLSAGLVVPVGATPLPPLAPGAEKTIYLRDNELGSYQALVTAGNVPPGTKFGESGTTNVLTLAGASANLQHVAIASAAALTPDAVKVPSGLESLYILSAGKLQLASILPNGEPANVADLTTFLGLHERLVRNAVSDDGSRVVWEASGSERNETPEEKHLYVRDLGLKETVRIDTPEAGAGSGESSPEFQGASPDDSKIFFTDKQRLTSDSHASEFPDLYVADVSSAGGHLAATVTDLTKDSAEFEGEPESGAFQGIMIGYSEDASTLYFVANGVLAAGASHGNCLSSTGTGACNLYREHFNGSSWETSFIASLPGDNFPDWGFWITGDLTFLTARVSPSGRYLAFMSNTSLTGFDNHDANSGAQDEEVFLYDSQTGHIACASCNAAGAHPQGVRDTGTSGQQLGLLVDHPEAWVESNRTDPWLAGSIPGWTSIDVLRARYQPRYLLDSGQLFFDSPDALVPGDVNGKEDVYQYRPAGTNCSTSDRSLTEVYKQESEAAGCVSLISPGTSRQESAFLDASSSGEDVFFLTASQLAATDNDESFDVYDAHVCSASSPCHLAGQETPPAPCEEEAACRGAGTPPPVFGAPTSATFSGAGNFTPPPASKPSSTVAQRLAKALKACRRHHRARGPRLSCERKARKVAQSANKAHH